VSQPDIPKLAAGAVSLVELCERVAEQCDHAVAKAQATTTAFEEFARAVDVKAPLASRKRALEDLAPRYLGAWKALGTLTPNSGSVQGVSALIERAREAFDSQNFTVSGFDFRDQLRLALKQSLPPAVSSVFDDLSGAIADPAATPENMATGLVIANNSGSVAELGAAIEALEKIDVDTTFMTSLEQDFKRDLGETVRQLSEYRSSMDAESPIGERLQAVREARKLLLEQLDQTDRPVSLITLASSSISLRDAANQLSNEVGQQLQRLKPLAMSESWEATRRVLLEDSRWSRVAKEVQSEWPARTPPLNAQDDDKALARLIDASIREANGAIAAAFEGAANVRASADNPVLAIRNQPFVAADPNIQTITKPENAENWRTVPVDALAARGDGLTEFIIVQDGPTTYRLKELRVDPRGVVGFQLSVADVGIDLLRAVAETRFGLGLPSKGDNNDPQQDPSTSPTGALAEQERLLNDSLRDALSGLTKFLQSETFGLADNTDLSSESRERVQGRLRGELRRLRALHEAASHLRKPALEQQNSVASPDSDVSPESDAETLDSSNL
jgi:sugar-specific transcriptional regulator TrmB